LHSGYEQTPQIKNLTIYKTEILECPFYEFPPWWVIVFDKVPRLFITNDRENWCFLLRGRSWNYVKGSQTLKSIFSNHGGRQIYSQIYPNIKLILDEINTNLPTRNKWRFTLHVSELPICSLYEYRYYLKKIPWYFCFIARDLQGGQARTPMRGRMAYFRH
jgi:hypothetical protein